MGVGELVMSWYYNIVIVCDYGCKGDGCIEYECCDFVVLIIWVDEIQGWLLQVLVVVILFDDDNQL